MRLTITISLLLLATWTGAPNAQPCCIVPDNGSGTIDLPPDCAPDGYEGTLELIEGLPAGGTMDLDARLTNIAVSSRTPGGTLGGTVEVFTAFMLVEVTGGGTLAGFHRNLNVPVTGETHSAPRTPGDPVQSFAVSMYKLQGILSGDYDFNLLWFEGGAYYGLPSPGHTTLTRLGGPGSDFAVESEFHYSYRIQFEGRQESEWIEGYRGITLDLEADYVLCGTSAVLGAGSPPVVAPSLTVTRNPFRSTTDLVLDAPEGPVTLSVFDTHGRLVRTLVREESGIEGRRLAWNGKDGVGRPVPGGVYFLRLEAGDRATSRRVVRIP